MSLATVVVMASMLASVSPATLTQDIIVRVRQALPSANLEVAGPLSLKVIGGPADGSQINIDRLATYCERNSAAECEDQKQKFTSGIVEFLSASSAITPSRFRVVVRSQVYASELSKSAEGAKSGPLVMVPLMPGLEMVLVADFPRTSRVVGEGDLKALGLSRDEAIKQGVAQVLAVLPHVPDAKTLDRSAVVIAGQDYGASLLLAADQWRSLAKDVHGILWVAVPADERVLVGVARSEAELVKLKASVEGDYATAPRGVSPLIFRYGVSGWSAIGD